MGTILGRKVYSPRPGHIMFQCDACGYPHGIPVDGSRGWTWNGDGDKPTVTPSLLCTMEYGDKTREKRVCHTFIVNGQWQYLGDCTHAMAGQTVDIPDWPHGSDY
jgi:hypothetical protein